MTRVEQRLVGRTFARGRVTAPPRGTLGRARISAAVVLLGAALSAGCGEAASGSDGEAIAPPPAARDVRTPAPADGPPFVHRAEFEAVAAALFAGSNDILGRGRRDVLEIELARDDLPTLTRIERLLEFVPELLRLGEVERALHEASAARALVAATPDAPASLRIGVLRTSALAELRQAEVENCIARHAADCCILPLAGGGLHTVDGPARRAQEHLLAVLDLDPSALDVVWLLNIAAMALGEHPDGVPPEYLVPPSAFASEQDIGRFVDVAPELGVDTFDLCGGVAVEDFDGDGRLDIITSSFDPRAPLRAWRGLPDFRFEDVARRTGLDDQLGGLNIVAADHDGDGDFDLLVLRGAWLFDDGRIRNSLLRNDGAHFTDVTADLGLAGTSRPTQAGCFADFDGDGDLDLYIGNESRVDAVPPSTSYPGQLFVQGDDGRFVDRAAEAGVTNDRYAKGVCVGDYDNDGDLDLYVSNLTRNRLYRNDGALAFVDVAPALHVTEPEGRSFAPWFFDADNDGWLDLFVGGFAATIADVCADMLGRPHRGALPRLYKNIKGRFLDVTRERGLDGVWLPMGANFGDMDGDGFLDIYLGTGDPGYQTLVPNVALRNDGGRRFVDVTTSTGLGHVQKGHGVAFADFDGDGASDIFLQIGGFYPGDAYNNALFLNPGHEHRFLHVRLRGAGRNTAALGARLRVVVEDENGTTREIHRAVGSVSSFGGSPFLQEIGLGRATAVPRLEVRWPTSGLVQVFTDLPLDGRVLLVEGQAPWTALPAP